MNNWLHKLIALAWFGCKFTRGVGPQRMIIALPMKSADKRESKGDKKAHYPSVCFIQTEVQSHKDALGVFPIVNEKRSKQFLH